MTPFIVIFVYCGGLEPNPHYLCGMSGYILLTCTWKIIQDRSDVRPQKSLNKFKMTEVQESPVEAWVDSGLPLGQGH